MYYQPNSSSDWLQGDILRDILFQTIPLTINQSSASINIDLKKRQVMILSQSCDLARRPYIAFAPIFSLIALKSTGIKFNEKSLKEQKYNYWYYLPLFDSFQESYVDFTQITHMSPQTLDKGKRILGLSDLGRHWLAYKLNVYFGRPYTSEVEQ